MVDFTSYYTLPGIPYLWQLSLQPASWRGISFSVESAEVKRGRRSAVHAFPFAETGATWVEDLGLDARLVSINGFIASDFLTSKYNELIAAFEQKGPGVLVHPQLGSMTVQVVEFSASQIASEGRMFRFHAAFIEGLTANDAAASPVTPNATDSSAASDASTAADTDASAAVAG